MIQFGKYDQRVSFVTMGQIPDGFGGYVPNEQIILETFARAVQIRGSNDLESAQLELPKTFIIGVQQRTGFRPNQSFQVRYRGYLHVIKGIEQRDERYRKEHIITLVRLEESEVITPEFEVNTLDSPLDTSI